jgi:formylglycine-generating enzyme required for sulfatase activity
MSFSLRTRIVGVVALGLLVAGCPTGSDDVAPGPEDGGAPTLIDGSIGTDGQVIGDGATGDSAPPVPCGRLTVVCKDGEKCEGPPDCASKVCRTGICQTAAPADGAKNGDETDIDCGGSKAPACATGQGCLIGADCTSSVCKAGVCQAPSPTDGVKNGDETDKDCGGAVAPKCMTGQGCAATSDCDNVKCDLVQKKCLAASNSDGIKNLDETGIDCGGPTPAVPRCPPGQGCAANGDCANTACNLGTLVCDPPTSTDGIKNGTETDIDCGGLAPTNAPGCGTGLTCAIDNDCGSKACNYAQKCVETRSCKVQHGGDTCGPAGNESCCKSLPAGAATIDKYNITAGRMRAFVTATGGNMRAYINANMPAWWNAAWSAFLPNVLDNGGNTPEDAPAYSGVYQELGPYVHGTAGGGNEGCWINGGGARTYRLPDPINTRIGDKQFYSQDFLDDRPLQCVTVHIIAAFCAWDGGHLPTRAEINVAWGPQTYPWGAGGAANQPLGYQFSNATDPMGLLFAGSYGPYQSAPFPAAPLSLTNLAFANYNNNFWGGGTFVVGNKDYSIFIAPPGRFPNGNGPFGHADLAGNVFNSLDINGTNGAFWTRSGSWQGHPIPWSAPGNETNFPVHNKYWAMGGRCAR